MLHEYFIGHEDLYNWVVFPLLIFCARIGDVGLGTLRSVLAAKGKRKIVPFIGFFEVLIWLAAISQIMANLNNIMCYIAWAGGFSMGTYVGLLIEEKLALGLQIMRIITNQNFDELTDALAEAHYGYTIFDGHGARGPIKMIFTVVKRKEVKKVEELIRAHTPTAFISIEDVKNASQASYAPGSNKLDFFRTILPTRKGK
jgi:uncharacterized protein YebE (UPF0316 family)